MKCHECLRTEEEAHLHRCPICFKYFCEEHSNNMSGRLFCSKHCAEFFFFDDAEED